MESGGEKVSCKPLEDMACFGFKISMENLKGRVGGKVLEIGHAT